jgi:hypothetical protein
MSAFLGKIHYWLYDKIVLQEIIIENITAVAQNKGFHSEELLKESYSRFGFPVKGLLENEIDHGNIHGWLQQCIASVESRMAFVVTELVKNNIVSIEEIEGIIYQNAADTMNRLGIQEATPAELFQLIFDHMLEGMPCDRVNEVTEESETKVSWETTKDLHQSFWKQVGGDAGNHHCFRDAWIRGFLSASAASFGYTTSENGISTIERI